MSTPPATATKTRAAKAAKIALMLKDRTELLGALNAGAALAIREQLLTARLNKKLADIKAEYEAELDEIQTEAKDIEASVRDYAESHRDTLFGKVQSVEIGGHWLKWHDNGGAVKTVKKVTQEAALNRLLLCTGEEEAVADQFITWKSSLNKTRIKALYDEHAPFLLRMGLVIESEESFKIEYDLKEPAGASKAVA